MTSSLAYAESVTVKVGSGVDFSPGFLPAQVICDDVSIVDVVAGDESFRIKGLRAGKTDCGFVALTGALGRRRVITVNVAP